MTSSKQLGMRAKMAGRSRQHGSTLSREEYIDNIWPFILRALGHFFDVEIGQANDLQDAVVLWENELRRLLDLQIPNWITLAPTNRRFNRTMAIEAAISQIKGRGSKIRAWTTAGRAVAGHLKIDPSALRLPDRQQLEGSFFSRLRASCDAARKGPGALPMLASTKDVLTLWDHLSASLAYSLEAEIAKANGYFTHLFWWEDRADTYLDWFGDWIEMRRRGTRGIEHELRAAARLAIVRVRTDRIWNFASGEIAKQIAKPLSELLLPNRQAVEGKFFAKVRAASVRSLACGTRLRKEADDGA